MSHELDDTYGYENSMIYVGETPWHKLGTQVQPGLSVDEAIAACPAVDFETKMVDLFYASTKYPHDLPFRTKEFKGIARSDTEKLLGIASNRYSPIQIRDQWRGLDPLIDQGLATIETLGSLEGGKKVWGLVRFNLDNTVWWEQLQSEVGEIATYGLIMDDKTGKKSAILCNTPVRTVCANTLRSALGSAKDCIKIRHIGDTDQKLADAADSMWGGIIEHYQKLMEDYRALNSCILSEVEFEDNVLDPIAQIPFDINSYKTESRFEKAIERAKKKRRAVYNLWENGLGHSGDHSAWEAYNAAVQAIDHNEGGIFNKTNNLIGSLAYGPRAQVKHTINQNLMRLAA